MIVMKFGGTSVKDTEAVRRVGQVVGRERRPRLVVVSALSKVTDALLEVARLAERGDATAARLAVEALHRRQLLRKEPLLNLAGDLDFPVQAFTLRDLFGHSRGEVAVLQRQGGLSGNGLQQSHVAFSVRLLGALLAEHDKSQQLVLFKYKTTDTSDAAANLERVTGTIVVSR